MLFHACDSPACTAQRRPLYLLAHGAGSPLTKVSLLSLGFSDALGEKLSIFISSILGSLSIAALKCDAVALMLQTLGSDQTLDLRCLSIRLLPLALRLNFTTDNKLADIILLGEAKELPDLRSTLGAEALWVDGVGHAWDVGFARLDDRKGEDGQVHCDDAAADGFALALTSAAGAVAGVAVGEEEADSRWVHDALFHGETLLVVAAGDFENVTFEFVADTVARDFSSHALVHENAETSLIIDLDELLTAIGRVRDIELHCAQMKLSRSLSGSRKKFVT